VVVAALVFCVVAAVGVTTVVLVVVVAVVFVVVVLGEQAIAEVMIDITAMVTKITSTGLFICSLFC